MWVQGVCNLLATLSKPPWTKPLNWDLHMTIDGEVRTPFHLYITYEYAPPYTSSQAALVSRFSQLTTELQLRVLDFCSAPVLYQMMHTSMLRIEAAKRFWSDPDTYYLVEAALALWGWALRLYMLRSVLHGLRAKCGDLVRLALDDKIAPIRDDVLEHDYDKAR